MKKNDQIDQLFKEMCIKHPYLSIGFKKDGIINEDLFDNQKKKVLFICKEPNDPTQTEGDFRTWWQQKLYGIHAHRVGAWSHGILNGFPDIQNISRDDKMSGLSKIAYLNLKKIGGAGNSNISEICMYAKQIRHELIDQITIINPDIIIGGVSSFKVWDSLFGRSDMTEISETGFLWRNKHVLHFYHPSARKSNLFLYEELKRRLEGLI